MDMEYSKTDLARFAEIREGVALLAGLGFTVLSVLTVVLTKQTGGWYLLPAAKSVTIVGMLLTFGLWRAYDTDGYCRLALSEISDYDFSIHDIERP